MAKLTLVNTVEGNLELEGEVVRNLQGEGYIETREGRMKKYKNKKLSRNSRGKGEER